MNHVASDSNDEIYFISDAHLGSQAHPAEQEKEARLCAFFRAIRGRAHALYILGDFFDFWFEYRSVVPRTGGKVLFELYNLTCSGTQVVYLGGNHDFWLGSYLSAEVGIQIHTEPIEVVHNGLRIFLAHGDEFYGGAKYRLFRKMLHHPLSSHLFRALHPDVGALLARWASRVSGEKGAGCDLSRFEDGYMATARQKFDQGCDVAVFGHLHIPLLREEGGKSVLVLGDWVHHFSYARLQGTLFSLHRWEERNS
ncbi:MAG: UDP-2,3-diacylglucosamine diphosphatase [Candidatus Latescibacterota bacterium]